MKLADIVRVELVDTDEDADRRRSKCPGEDRSQDGELAFVEVVDKARVKLQANDQMKGSYSMTSK